MKRRSLLFVVALLLGAIASPMVGHLNAQAGASLVISQVYGGGGNNGGAFSHDFIELFNRGNAAINVNGWSVQYASAAGTTWAVTNLSGSIPPGGYYLVRQAMGANSPPQPPLPAPDATGSVAMSATSGKVALASTTVALTGACPAAVDFLGFGGSANCFETARTANLANGTAAIRNAGGCTDTDNNLSDFSIAAPTPRNSASPLSPCTASTNPSVNASNPTAEAQQAAPVVVTATVTPGTNPASTGLVVRSDLSALGGAAGQLFADDGVIPDAAAGDNVFTTTFPLNPGLGAGTYAFTVEVEDAQLRTGADAATLTVTPPPVVLLPHQVQGNGSTSPLDGQAVTVRGVVTARKINAFFIQTMEGFEDADPSTSEGLMVFTSGAPPAVAAVGRLVQVSGTVDEFGNAGVTVTELTGPTVTDLGPAPLPAAYVLTPADVPATGTRDQLERFEGMRVFAASVTAVAGTDGAVSEANATASSFGEVDVVLTGQPRPFREPGLEPGTVPLNCANFPGPCNLPAWDGNPELFRIDTNGIAGTAIRNVSTGAVFTNVTGPLDHAFGNYVILAETQLEPVGGITLVPAAPAAANQFTVASFNMERFFDTTNDLGSSDVVLTPLAYNNRLNKASLMIRDVLGMPDIIGVQEVEKIEVLDAIAAKVNADAGAANPQYAAYLFEGNDPGGIDVGFLVRTGGGRVTVQSVEQVGLDATFIDPSDGSEDLLNDRPPVFLRATIQGPATLLPQDVTVIVNHLRSLNGADANTNTGVRVRAKRRAQAEFLAGEIQAIQIGDPDRAVISVGDYNAFAFNDGLGDLMGTILGQPSPADQVVEASTDLVEPNLVDVAGFIPEAERYSYIFGGSAQTLDHVIVTQDLVPQFAALVHPRVNADAASILRSDPSIPHRLSDHDPAVAYFTFPADVEAPVFTLAPGNLTVEATGPDGAVVTFDTPEATDNLDPAVTVSCAPASGTIFAAGNTGVTCSASDLAGNTSSVSFTVTVTLPVAGRMTGGGGIESGDADVHFTFQVEETAVFTQAGHLNLRFKSGKGQPDRLLSGDVTIVNFSSPAGGVSFAGTGMWNGEAGYTFEVSAHDHGEPGVGHDTFAVVVKAPNGAIVEAASGTLRQGNVQSHD